VAPRRDDLVGAIAVVTGATGGIGRAIAAGLAASGAHVFAVGRNAQTLADLGPALEAYGIRYGKAIGDLADAAQIERMAGEAWAWRGRVDVVVNAAGVIRRSSLEDTHEREWDETFAVNARGPFLLTRELGARMLEGDGGAVVNVTSMAGDVVTGAPVAYGASKAALIYLTKYLAVRWAPKVRVNAVAPGYVRTDLNADWLSEQDNLRYVLDRTPLDRVATPEDIVGAALFLSSPAAAYITGHNLVADGGWTAQ
jgi:NAD(P)-dependent dehydrogenase (short-subunit alcohol dehydrogenase family)